MKRISDFAELTALLKPWRGRGIESNNYLMPAAYKKLILRGRLFYALSDKGLLLFENRDTYRKLYYHLAPDAQIGQLPDDLPISTEIVLRGDRPVSEMSAAFLSEMGFADSIRFLRMTADSLITPNPDIPSRIKYISGAEHAVMRLFSAVFEPVLANFPGVGMYDNLLAAMDGDTLAGAMHYDTRSKTVMLVAVGEAFRKTGVASRLFSEYAARTADNSAPHKIWVASDNEAAIGLYKKLGFSFDGLASRLFVRPAWANNKNEEIL